MWKNYVLTTIRVLAKNKKFAFINIFGLSVALAVSLLIATFVRHELSYDKWISDHERVFRVETVFNVGNAEPGRFIGAPAPLVQLISENVAGVELFSRYMPVQHTFALNGELVRQRVMAVDPQIVELLGLTFIEGSPDRALLDPNSLVLTQKAAIRLLGRTDVLGETIQIQNEDRSFRVTGVIEDVPVASHFRDPNGNLLEALMPHDDVAASGPGQWFRIAGLLYIKMSDAAANDISALEKQLDDLAAPHLPVIPGRPENAPQIASFRLNPVAEIHLGGAFSLTQPPSNKLATLLGYTLVGLIILSLAAVNFTNLWLARSLQRIREVALRKVLGASRFHVVGQFLGEAVFVALIALLFGTALAEIALPGFSMLVGSSEPLNILDAPLALPIATLLAVAVGVLGGAYPAFVASTWRPAQLVGRGEEKVAGGRIRAALTVLQFSAGIGLVICTLIVFQQVQHVRTAELGYSPEQVIMVDYKGPAESMQRYRAFVNALEQTPEFAVAALAAHAPTNTDDRITIVVPHIDNPEERVQVSLQIVSTNYFDALKVEPLLGRLFENGRESDLISQNEGQARGSVILNEAAVQALGFKNSEDALNDVREWRLDQSGPVALSVIGVVSDINLYSLKQAVEPMIFVSYHESEPVFATMDVLIAQANGLASRNASRSLEMLWKQMMPDQLLNWQYLDARLAAQYEEDARQAESFGWAAAIAILIACVGLYGMAGYNALRRTREIAIRKVLGAHIDDVVRLMSWSFAKPVLLANLVAWPVAFYFMQGWLESFAFRIEISVWPFLLSGLFSLALALITVAGHALKVSRTHPAAALKVD